MTDSVVVPNDADIGVGLIATNHDPLTRHIWAPTTSWNLSIVAVVGVEWMHAYANL